MSGCTDDVIAQHGVLGGGTAFISKPLPSSGWLKTIGNCWNMDKKVNLGLQEALQLLAEHIEPLQAETVELVEGQFRVLAADVTALVDSPSVNGSLKDGYAVRSRDVAKAAAESPVILRRVGLAGAGDDSSLRVDPGTTVRVLTGAAIPDGADAVVAEEFVRVDNDRIVVMIDAEPGRNILPKGSDVARGAQVADKGARITPGLLGLLAAAGHGRLEVFRSPAVAIVATGDEVVAPGRELPRGKLYASNITTLAAWCRRYGFGVQLEIVRDDPEEILRTLERFNRTTDALITSGGAWTGDRDLVAKVLDQLGWEKVFHRIRIGPGKAVGFGMLRGKPVFILPGGPPSNLMGFLQIALPGLLKLSGSRDRALPATSARVTEDLHGRFADWTQFIYGRLIHETGGELPIFSPQRSKSRLRSMAEAEAVVSIPEGQTSIPAGSIVRVQLLT